MKSTPLILSSIFLSLMVLSSCQTAEEDKVYVQDHVNYTHDYYSGYLPTSISQSVHYVFFESQSNVKKDPLVIFLNGGPGCSSLSSLFHENGPFIFMPGEEQHLTINDYAWNKRANLLYFELPAGVGFSTSANSSLEFNDIDTAETAFHTLRQFYARFPDYRGRDLYLTGHGYAAVFHSYLAKRIIEHNEDPYQILDGKINLKGLLLGNPCVEPQECYASGSFKRSFYHYEFLYKRAFFPTPVYEDFRGACVLDYNDLPCFEQRQRLDKMFNETNSSSLNIYDKCYKTVESQNVINSGCEDESNVINYLNQESLKENWHVNPQIQWKVCNWKVFQEYIPDKNSYWLMPMLREKGLRLWIFSGDFDSEVPITGTKAWIQKFKEEYQIHTKKVWREWWRPGQHKGEDQVGGNIWELDGLTFVTVRAAGFRASIDKPLSMDSILNGFLDSTSLPQNPNLPNSQARVQ